MDDDLRFRLDIGLALLAGCFLVLVALGLRQTPDATLALLVGGGLLASIGWNYVRAAYEQRTR